MPSENRQNITYYINDNITICHCFKVQNVFTPTTLKIYAFSKKTQNKTDAIKSPKPKTMFSTTHEKGLCCTSLD